MAIWGALGAAAIGVGSKLLGVAFKKKTKLPPPPYVSPLAVGEQQMAAWEQIMPRAEDIAAAVNRFNIGQALSAANQFGYGGIRDLQTSYIKSLLRGELPSDVRSLIGRQSAAAALAAGGGPGSFSWSYSPLSMGLTSLQLKQQGMAAAGQFWNQFASVYRPFDYTAAFMPSWSQMASLAQWNELQRYGRGAQQAALTAAHLNRWSDALSGTTSGLGQVGDYALGTAVGDIFGVKGQSSGANMDMLYSLATLLSGK